MNLLTPTPPPYDALVWEKLPFAERTRQVCQTWALQGYGAPPAVLVVYLLKIALFIAAWAGFCSLSPSLGGLSSIATWWSQPLAFQKAILWAMAFESLGLGCGSGPLTGRYLPPVGGFLHFLRPGTTKRPLFEGLPVLGGFRRTWLDVALYALHLGLLGRALVASELSFEHLWPIALLVPVLGLADRTLFLAARAEHYWTMTLCFAFAPEWMAGAKCVQLALWFWAGVSKLNPHFPAVVCVMLSNSPVTRFAWFRKRLYRSYPDDLRPSSFARWLAHAGTALELGVPLVLAASGGGPTLTLVGLAMMCALHGFILSSVPMAVPLEWNVVVLYGGFLLFGAHADVSFLAVQPWWLAAALVGLLVVVPLLGNLKPGWISFLCAMRYYAGNWAYGVWLFKGESYRKLERLTKAAPWFHDQLKHFYDRRTAVGLVGRVLAFRAMHLHGRALQLLVPKLVDRVEDHEWVDGELVAGLALGWNFGDAHLHDESFLAALQAQCGFEAGEVRCLFVESQPLFGRTLSYRLADAKTGVFERGALEVRALEALQPWPT